AENPADYSIIGEIKNRESKKFSKEEAGAFLVKFEQLKKAENVRLALPFVFTLSGLTAEAEDFCRQKGIAYSTDNRWLD
ncbi:MAG: hypothetical protein GY757_02860, partial [bacterium]|nr:hypothetical protein [bacterium]